MNTTMKKSYRSPKVNIVVMNVHENLLTDSITSLGINEGATQVSSGEEFVKQSNRDSYNVWDDDWSK